MNEPQKHNLKKNILSAIETGRAVMRPRWHFVLKAALIASGAILVGLTALYVVSLALFVLRETGVLFVPGFGFRGVVSFILAAPWLLLFITVPFIVILELLVRRYPFAYRKPVLLTTLGVAALTLAGSYAFEEVTEMHEQFSGYAEEGELPLVGGLYQRYEMLELEDIHRGVVTELHERGFSMENRRETLDVLVDGDTEFSGDIRPEEGDHVVVLGEREDDTVYAEGIRLVPEGRWSSPRGEREERPGMRRRTDD